MSTSVVTVKPSQVVVVGNFRKQFDAATMEEMKRSIEKHGIINPITVRKEGRTLVLVAGERRLRAAIDLGLKAIPATVVDFKNGSDPRFISLAENLQRTDLSVIEKGDAVLTFMKDKNMTETQIAASLGLGVSSVSTWKQAAELAAAPKEVLREAKAGMKKTAKAITAIKKAAKRGASEQEQKEIAKQVVKEKAASSARDWHFDHAQIGFVRVRILEDFKDAAGKLELVGKILKLAFQEYKKESGKE